MNERNLKRLGYAGLGLEIIAIIILIIILINNEIFNGNIIVPEFTIYLLWIGLVLNMISIFLRNGLKRYKKQKKH